MQNPFHTRFMEVVACMMLVCLALGRVDGREAASDADESQKFLRLMGVPTGLVAPNQPRPLVIAVVDDAVRITHQDLKGFLWENPREIPRNRVDDDGNGFVDDIQGWDIADDDGDVAPPEERPEFFYHGTHVAGILTQVMKRAYGEAATDLVRILPVKSMSDESDRPYLKQGYRGIQYAADVGADLVLIAWGEAHSTRRELDILQSAADRGVLLVSAAGNFPEERDQFPAAYPTVVAVTSVDDTGTKIPRANYGGFVDLVAPGQDILSADSTSDTARQRREGTSMSAAIVAAAAAIVKIQRPELNNDEVMACLKNTARPVEEFQDGEIYYGGKLGAGLPNVRRAIHHDLNAEPVSADSERRNHQGYLAYYRSTEQPVTWRIRPEGTVDGFWFHARMLEGDPGNSSLKLYQPGGATEDPFLDIPLRHLPEKTFVPGPGARVILEPGDAKADFQFLAEYRSQPIDQSTLYCEGTVAVKEEGMIEDGSGTQNYSPRSSCKWQITAPAGKVIRIKFLEFDTEAKTDWVYFFNGRGTHEDMMAGFSGPELPPELTTWGHEALMWFVTNESSQGRGWKARITFVDPDPSR